MPRFGPDSQLFYCPGCGATDSEEIHFADGRVRCDECYPPTEIEQEGSPMCDNKVVGHGTHSHQVPTVPGLVVQIRDGAHKGTEVYFAEDEGYRFVSLDSRTVETAERCVLIDGFDFAEGNAPPEPYGCDLDTPRGLCLVGVALDDTLEWVGSEARVLWDSAGDARQPA